MIHEFVRSEEDVKQMFACILIHQIDDILEG